MITIKDMADMANVSPTTVSNVLHGRTKKMSKDTLKRVQDVIDNSDYVSNMGARLLANYGSRIIGVILNYDRRGESNILADAFYGKIVGALEAEIRNHNYYMMLYTAGSVEETVKLANSWNIEGLIALGIKPSDASKMKEKLNVPVVFIDAYFDSDNREYHNIGLQDYEGGYLMTNFLISKGHRKIAFLADEDTVIGVDKERLEGYKQALKDNGLKYHEGDYIALNYREQIRHNRLWEMTESLIRNYTALFFASDFYASEAINIFSSKGYSVPEDISIVGFDNSIFSRFCRPQLTTVEQDVAEKGRMAFEMLYDLINDVEISESSIRLPVKLVVRDSVKDVILD